MKKKIGRPLIAILLLLALVTPLTAVATSYPPASLYHQEYIAETVMKAGEIVHMFHSGTNEIKSTIHADDILTVYRIDTSCKVKEVGKIRIISYVGETYLKGEVVEGEIRPNDIAKKGNVSCLVISVGLCNH